MRAREAADVRRQSLIDAAAATLAEHGVAGTSVRSICARAGVSPGLLTHYFAGVSALIAETYRVTAERVAATLETAVEQAGSDPRARAAAFLTASFRPPIAEPALFATWLAFWSAVKADPAIAAIHRQTYQNYRGQLEQLLRSCGISPVEAGAAALALSALVDGLWLELSLDPGPVSHDGASDIVVRWLDVTLERREATSPAPL
ncbi:transcriptional regulator BetI [uncultured Sphingomonas sp.]|uniref:transcriptional regulator BetI n=1 Tax=uncultured Sphingomonas sp. TaxID=158754 RepID=UPI0025FF1149|nr:transcriptional regulator BetI [uncultured Sphingomonas sp.]